MDSKINSWEVYAAGLATASAIFLAAVLYRGPLRYIPATKDAQEGYIAPGRLEILTDDLDKNGEKETIVKIDGQSYLLMEQNKKPVLLRYEIRSAQVIPQE